jgi:hypothetical protein
VGEKKQFWVAIIQEPDTFWTKVIEEDPYDENGNPIVEKLPLVLRGSQIMVLDRSEAMTLYGALSVYAEKYADEG